MEYRSLKNILTIVWVSFVSVVMYPFVNLNLLSPSFCSSGLTLIDLIDFFHRTNYLFYWVFILIYCYYFNYVAFSPKFTSWSQLLLNDLWLGIDEWIVNWGTLLYGSLSRDSEFGWLIVHQNSNDYLGNLPRSQWPAGNCP